MTATNTLLDTERVEAFAGRVFEDLAAAVSAGLVYLGDRLGLYRTLSEFGAATSEELADRAGLAERYVREWLGNQAASGYVEYDPLTQRFTLPPEHAEVLAHEESAAFMAGGFVSTAGLFQVLGRIEDAFRTGEGVGWHEQDERLFIGCERFFAPAYHRHLIQSWLPSLGGVVERLEEGARVADIGCGHGLSTIIMAEAYPRSQFVGYDYHGGSIATARRRAAAAGVADRVRFERAYSLEVGDEDEPFDLITLFDCLHDMGNPEGAMRRARRVLKSDGVLMIVEPLAGDRLEENLHALGRAFYAFSTLACVPASLAQHGGHALGGQAGETRLREVLTRAGFRSIRRATETPANLVLEARS